MPELTAGEWTALVSTLTALVAVIVGPWVTWGITKRQIHASVVSANRQAWINALRERLSELQAFLYKSSVLSSTLDKSNLVNASAFTEHFERGRQLRTLIMLMLNPEEPAHKSLLSQIDRAMSLAAHVQNTHERELVEVQAAIIEQAQPILKAEWRRVKNGA